MPVRLSLSFASVYISNKTILTYFPGDVLDLSWSPQDRWLASASVDNTIIIWDMLAMPTIVTVLKGHTGLVKGVTWDPVGKFMASQSDDRSVKIWKTADWTCQSTITEPFEECGGTTHVLRLSWSPDGLYLVSAHAMNGGGPTAQIIEREGFKCDKDFVGHRKAVTCVVKWHSGNYGYFEWLILVPFSVFTIPFCNDWHQKRTNHSSTVA